MWDIDKTQAGVICSYKPQSRRTSGILHNHTVGDLQYMISRAGIIFPLNKLTATHVVVIQKSLKGQPQTIYKVS